MAEEQEIHETMIIDDDRIAVAELVKSLERHPEFRIVATCHNAQEGKQNLFEKQPKLLFLDVELPDMQGLALLNSIKEEIDWDMRVVFYSMHSKYILNAMRESAFDYLLKPFEQQELDGIIERFHKESTTLPVTSHVEPTSKSILKDSFLAATATGYRMIRLNEIGFFARKGLRRQWSAMLSNGDELFLRRGTNAKLILSYSPLFVQTDPSHIINVKYLAMICDGNCRLFPPFDFADDLKISQSQMRKLQELLNFI